MLASIIRGVRAFPSSPSLISCQEVQAVSQSQNIYFNYRYQDLDHSHSIIAPFDDNDGLD
jgi:hypothetical protein